MSGIQSVTQWFCDDSRERFWREKAGKIDYFDVSEKIDGGAFGTTKLLRPLASGKIKAIKCSVESLREEYEITLKWPKNSTGLLMRPKAYLPGDILIMHCYEGNLKDFHLKMDGKQKLEAICQLSQGLATLHSLHIMHNDLYLDNILYDTRLNRYDLADFGIAVNHEKIFKQKSGQDVDAFVKLIDSILFGDHGRKDALLAQGYSQEVAKKILDFFASLPSSARDVSAFFQSIRL